MFGLNVSVEIRTPESPFMEELEGVELGEGEIDGYLSNLSS
mgnify:CR=1 FL=1